MPSYLTCPNCGKLIRPDGLLPASWNETKGLFRAHPLVMWYVMIIFIVFAIVLAS